MRQGRNAKKRILVLTLVIFAQMFLVVPAKILQPYAPKPLVYSSEVPLTDVLTDKNKTTFSFSFENLYKRTFYVPGETFALITLHREKPPTSFSGNLGFFLSWFFWLSFISSPWICWRYLKTSDLVPEVNEKRSFRIHLYLLFLIWFSATIAGFSNGISVFDTRLLNFAYVPCAFLLLMAVYLIESMLPGVWRIIFRMAMVVLISLSVGSNFGFFYKQLRDYAPMQDSVVRCERDAFRDFYHEEPDDKNLYERHQDFESRAVFVDWYDWNKDWFGVFKQKIDKEEVVYFYTRDEQAPKLLDLMRQGYASERIGKYRLFDATPMIFRFYDATRWIKNKLRKKKKNEDYIYLYKIHSPVSETI